MVWLQQQIYFVMGDSKNNLCIQLEHQRIGIRVGAGDEWEMRIKHFTEG